MLVGDAGVGKTRIAREVASLASERGVARFWGSCLEGDWQPAYGPWVEAIEGYAQDSSPTHILRGLGPGGALLSRLVPHIGDSLPDGLEAPALGFDEERVRVTDAIIRFFLAVSRQSPLLLVIDDLHWADRDSLRVLRYLSHFLTRSRIFVIGIYREPELELTSSHPLSDLLPVLQGETDYRQVIVQGLGLEEVAEYLSQSAGHPLPGALTRAIHRETSGNPYYVREVLRHLTEEGKIQLRGGRWSTDLSIREMGIPDGVRKVVRRRLSRLSAGTNAMLRMASGFTGGFDFAVLQLLSGLPEELLLDCVDEALRAGLLAISRTTPTVYSFAHAIARHSIYEEMNPDRRARLHRRIAIALEGSREGHTEAAAAELAFQYHASSSIRGAGNGLVHALKAAEQARATWAYDREVGFLSMAYELATESTASERAWILCRKAVAEATALRLREAEATAGQALAALEALGAAPRARAEFLAEAARALKEGGAGAHAWGPLVDQGLALLDSARGLPWARLMLLRDPFEPIAEGPVKSVRWIGHDPQAVAVARARGNEDDYAQTLEPLEWRSRQETDSLLVLVRGWKRPAAILRGLDVVARDLLKHHRDLQSARALYLELLQTSERYGSIPGQAEALMQLAFIQAVLGELPLAQQTAKRAEEMILRLGPGHELRFGVAALKSVLAYLLDSGLLDSATSAAEFVASPEAARNPRGLVAAAYAALGYLRAGDETQARDLLAALTPVLEPMKPTMYVLHAAVAFGGSAVWEMGEVQFAQAYRRMAVGLVEAGFTQSMLLHELTVARMSTLLGDTEDADIYFALALEKARAQGLKPILAVAEYDKALALSRQGVTPCSRAVELVDSALTAFRSMGMSGWAGRAVSLRERLVGFTPMKTNPAKGVPGGLTSREHEVLLLLSAGSTNNSIARDLTLSVRTVEQHVANIYKKLGVRSRVEAATRAAAMGVTDLPRLNST